MTGVQTCALPISLTIGNEYDLRSDYILFADESGTVITQSDNFPEDLRQLFIQKVRALGPQEKTVDTLTANDLRVRVFTFRSALTKNSHDIMQVGTDLRPTLDFLHKRLLLRLSAIPLIAVLTALFGLFLVRQILKPVREITSAAQKITHEDLNARIQTKHADEEMFFLVNAFNNMIARLESSFKYMKDFSSHAAHELKTPLAIIRGEAQIALKSTRSEQEYQRVLSVISGETSRMIRVVEDLLLMAKVDYESNVFQFEPFDFDEFLKDIHEQSKILAAHKNITVNLQPLDTPAIMNGDHLHLRRLFFNLIDNAIRFSPQDSRIDIAVQTANGQLKVSVSDYGTASPRRTCPEFLKNSSIVTEDREGKNRVPDSVWPLPSPSPRPTAAILKSKASSKREAPSS